jgi:hypothetical protein
MKKATSKGDLTTKINKIKVVGEAGLEPAKA